MSRQARVGTLPEMALRRLLHDRGLRYRVNWPVPDLRRRTIDLAFTRARVAVYVHGCFWHGCPQHGTSPQANSAWWQRKLDRNRERDESTRQHLERLGWVTVEIWEHEPPAEALQRVLDVLSSRDQRPSKSSP